MRFYKKKGCRWNYNHTNILHREWSNNTGNLCLPVTHVYWCKYEKKPNGQQGGANNDVSMSGSGDGTTKGIQI